MPKLTSMSLNPKTRSRLFNLLRLGLMFGLLVGIAYWVDLKDLGRLLLRIPVWLLVIGPLLGLLRLWLMSLRWWLLESADRAQRAPAVLPAAGGNSDADDAPLRQSAPAQNTVPPLTLGMCFRYRWAASTINLIAPAMVGADLGRMAMVSIEHRAHRIERSVVIIFDRVIGMLALAVLGFVAGIASPGIARREIYLLCVGIFLAIMLALLFGARTRGGRTMIGYVGMRWGRVGRGIAAVLNAWVSCSTRMRKKPSTILAAVCITFLTHGVSIVLVYCSAVAVEADIPFLTLAMVTAISWLVTIIPIGIGGLGLRELTFVVQLVPQGVSPALATSISLFQFAVIFVIGVLGVPLLVFHRRSTARSVSDELVDNAQ